ncbi:MAG: bifunctional ADP-heptose synthase [Chloroflexota bacterium]|nr:bifunctional ADP-heptose synthase [Chloroflexota bacterium]
MAHRTPLEYGRLLERFRELTVAVVGDVCLDRYVFGRPTRLSREAPVPVLEWVREHCLPGAASNPALNLASLGATAFVVGVTGDDPASAELRELLRSRGARVDALIADPYRHTTEKTRILAEGLLVLPQQLARIDRSDKTPISPERERNLCERLQELSPLVDAFLVSDYKGGVVSDGVIECIRQTARERGVVATVDSQGDLYRFRGFDCVRCNRSEAESVLRRHLSTEDDFQRELPALCADVGCGSLVVTRDGDGASFYSHEEGYGYIPAVRVPVSDAVGAGDTFISLLTLVLACGEPLSLAAHVANRAAALVVQHVGNACPNPEELLRTLEMEAEADAARR